MTISQIMEKMIAFSNGNIHDIDHFVRVWNYAKTIAELEKSIQKRNAFWKRLPSHTTLHALSAVRNTETPTENIRRRKAFPW